MFTRVDPSSQLKRAVRSGWEVRSDIVPSVSHFFLSRALTNASKRTSTGTAIVFEAEIEKPWEF